MKNLASWFLASFAVTFSSFASHFPDCSVNQYRERICKGDSVKVSGVGRRSLMIGKLLKFVDFQGRQAAIKVNQQILYTDINDLRPLTYRTGAGYGHGHDFEYNEGGGEIRPGNGYTVPGGPVLPPRNGYSPGTIDHDRYGNYYSPVSPYQWALAHDIARNGDYRTLCYAFSAQGQVLNNGNPISDYYCKESKKSLAIFEFKLADDIAKNGDSRTLCYAFSGRGEILNQGNSVSDHLCPGNKRDLAVYELRLAHEIARNGDYRTLCYAFNPKRGTILNQGNPVSSYLCNRY